MFLSILKKDKIKVANFIDLTVDHKAWEKAFQNFTVVKLDRKKIGDKILLVYEKEKEFILRGKNFKINSNYGIIEAIQRYIVFSGEQAKIIEYDDLKRIVLNENEFDYLLNNFRKIIFNSFFVNEENFCLENEQFFLFNFLSIFFQSVINYNTTTTELTSLL